MDKLDRRIAELRAEIEALSQQEAAIRRNRSAAEDRLRIYEEAADLRPLHQTPVVGALTEYVARRGGRKPGSISKEWRRVLATMWRDGAAFNYQQIQECAQTSGITAQLSSVRDRVRNYTALGFMEQVGDGVFRVTDEGFKKADISETADEDDDPSSPEAANPQQSSETPSE